MASMDLNTRRGLNSIFISRRQIGWILALESTQDSHRAAAALGMDVSSMRVLVRNAELKTGWTLFDRTTATTQWTPRPDAAPFFTWCRATYAAGARKAADWPKPLLLRRDAA